MQREPYHTKNLKMQLSRVVISNMETIQFSLSIQIFFPIRKQNAGLTSYPTVVQHIYFIIENSTFVTQTTFPTKKKNVMAT